MKILYVNTMGIWGGVATYLSILIKNQIKHNNKVYLVLGSKGKFYDYVVKKMPFVKLVILPYFKRQSNIVDIIKASIRFRYLVKIINPNIIHLNCMMSGIVGRLGTIGLHKYIIYNAHGWDFEPRVRKTYRILAIIVEKLLSYLTNKIICVSQYEYNLAKRYHIFKCKNQGVVIHNGVPNFHKLYNKITLPDVPFIISMAARFDSPKYQTALIYAVHILIKRHYKILLFLLGNGPKLNKCKKIVDKFKLNNNIIFTGDVNNVLKYYAKSQLIMLISKSEGSPMSLIEAMSIGKPLIASNVGGVPELIHNNGICTANSYINIANNIQKLINNNRLRNKMAKYSYYMYLKYYTQDAMVYETNKLYVNGRNK